MKGKKEDENEIVTKLVGIIFTVISYKNLSEIPFKIFATQCFFIDHLKHKTVNIITCRKSSEYPRQLCTH